jgi:hypothetical protein
MTGVMSEPIDLNNSFEAVFEELISHVLDKIGNINGDPSLYDIVFATKWVTGKTANTNPKKGANPVEVNSFADFRRESNLLALRTTIADAVKRKRKILTVGSHILQVVATVNTVSTESETLNEEEPSTATTNTVAQTATNRQLASMKDLFDGLEDPDPYLELQKLQDKYRCLECSSNGICYRQKHPDTGRMVHINLEPHILTLWAVQIVAGTAVPCGLPTHIAEFEKLVRDAFYPPAKKKKAGQQLDSNSGFQGDVHVHNHTTINNVPSPATPCNPKKLRGPANIFSPIQGFTAKDYKTRGLIAFVEWCEAEYQDEEGEFREAYIQLCEKKVGLDVLNHLSADDLINGCKVQYGTAWRIVKGYPEWRAFLKVLNPDSTMTKLICSNLRRDFLANCLRYFERHLIKIFV